MTLLKFLFITICLIWLVRAVLRFLLPMLFHNLMNKAQAQAQQQYGQRNRSSKPEGSINIDFIPPKDREAKAADKAGDFVDYEEIK